MNRFSSVAVTFGLVLNFLFVNPVHADHTITSGYRNVVIKTCAHDAEAICSIKWKNKEFIDDYDHGRQLQSAVSFDGLGEAYNPTEAGAEVPYNEVNPSPSSSLAINYSTSANPPTIKGANLMAYWRPYGGKASSNWVHSKNVAAYEGAYATYLKYDVQMGAMPNWGEPVHATGQFESLTGYMPSSFSAFYTLDVKGSRQMATISYCVPPFTNCSPEQPLPLIFATTDGQYAMGIYNRNLPQAAFPHAGFGRWNFAATTGENVVKWNNVFRLTNIQPGVTYYFTSYVVIGSLDNVRQQMLWLYDNGY